MINQKILPALKTIKAVERVQKYNGEYVVLMDIHISQLGHAIKYLKKANKKIFIHLELIKGLKSDEFATEYLIHDLGVDGIISIKSAIIDKVKKLNKIAIQRIFLIDTHSLERSIEFVNKSKPDYIELLPGCIPKMIKFVSERTSVPVLAGGLIDTDEEVKMAINNGAVAITSSKLELVNRFN